MCISAVRAGTPDVCSVSVFLSFMAKQAFELSVKKKIILTKI